MRQICTILLTLVLFAGSSQVFGQVRYLDEIFSDVTRTDTIPFGQNITIITGAPMMRPLFMDIYEPTGDTVSQRPLIVMAATGNFLPKIFNGGPNGTIKDSTVVEIATRLAKTGYVVAVIDHRRGWDFTNTDQVVQTRTLLQAAYRGIQDMRSSIRFFRRSVAEPVLPPPSTTLNPFRIDPTRIGVGGVGTGGYISLGTAYLSDYATEIALFKFTDPMTSVPYIVESVHGNMDGTNYGISPANDTLSVPNHVGYNDDVSVSFNLGGALGDTVWIDANEPPSINFHVPVDPFAPYDVGVVIVPTTGNVVIDQAAGGKAVARINNRLGNNDVFVNAGFNDAYTTAANAVNGGDEGFFPFIRPFTPGQQFMCDNQGSFDILPEGSPWDWWNGPRFSLEWDAVFQGMGPYGGAEAQCRSLQTNVDMSPTKGRTYCDSVIGYLLPRLAASMTLLPTGLDELKAKTQLKVFPNPASQSLYFRTAASSPIQSIEVLDATGRVLRRVNAVNAPAYTMDRDGLSTGLYFVKVNLAEGSITERIMLK